MPLVQVRLGFRVRHRVRLGVRLGLVVGAFRNIPLEESERIQSGPFGSASLLGCTGARSHSLGHQNGLGGPHRGAQLGAAARSRVRSAAASRIITAARAAIRIGEIRLAIRSHSPRPP